MPEQAADFPFVLTAHAAQVLAERRIPQEWVAWVLAQPLKTEPDRVDPSVRHALARIPEREGRMLRVVYNHTSKPWRIVTVYFDRGAGRQR